MKTFEDFRKHVEKNAKLSFDKIASIDPSYKGGVKMGQWLVYQELADEFFLNDIEESRKFEVVQVKEILSDENIGKRIKEHFKDYVFKPFPDFIGGKK